jgi:hypothetical protein
MIALGLQEFYGAKEKAIPDKIHLLRKSDFENF